MASQKIPPMVNFENPKLREWFQRIKDIHVSDLTKDAFEIFYLMAAFDEFRLYEPNLKLHDVSWRPQTDVLKEVFARLIAPERRGALNKWYAQLQLREMNPYARAFRDYLSQIVGENLGGAKETE